jgi:hypothetical protein
MDDVEGMQVHETLGNVMQLMTQNQSEIVHGIHLVQELTRLVLFACGCCWIQPIIVPPGIHTLTILSGSMSDTPRHGMM